MRLLSPVTSGRARPYISGVQLGKGGGGPRSGAEAGFVEQVGVRLKRQGDRRLLHASTGAQVSENTCAGLSVLTPSLSPDCGR